MRSVSLGLPSQRVSLTFCRNHTKTGRLLLSRMMSSGPSYLANVSVPAVLGPVPNDARDKSHWVRDRSGKGEPVKFRNPWESAHDYSFPELFSTMIHHKFISGNRNKPDTSVEGLKILKPTFSTSRTGSQTLRATWLGHACHYIEFPSGLRVLFDPVFEERCSPVSWLGHKRLTPPPCVISDIPIIDCVIISHSHYDHLSYPTVTEIHRLHPSVYFFVPKGLKKWFTDLGIINVVEMDWWEDVDITLSPRFLSSGSEKPLSSTTTTSSPSQDIHKDEVITARITCLPSQHTSARTPLDKALTLWASFSISSPILTSSPLTTTTPSQTPSSSPSLHLPRHTSVFFAGDTAYRTVPHPHTCPAFPQIGLHRGPFTLGLLPIGAYAPRHVLSAFHSDPFDAVEIFKETRCERAVAMHWGTWSVAEEDVMEPPRLLREALRASGLPESGLFDVCDVGETREY